MTSCMLNIDSMKWPVVKSFTKQWKALRECKSTTKSLAPLHTKGLMTPQLLSVMKINL